MPVYVPYNLNAVAPAEIVCVEHLEVELHHVFRPMEPVRCALGVVSVVLRQLYLPVVTEVVQQVLGDLFQREREGGGLVNEGVAEQSSTVH